MTLLSSALTLILICQVLYSFLVTRPTTTSQEEKSLSTEDLPETVICMEPGLDSGVLKKRGYNVTTYWRGSMDRRKFVGWNGDGNGNKSSHALLKEALTVDGDFRSLFPYVNFLKDHVTRVLADAKFRTLVYPYGRCLSISLSQESSNITGIDSLEIIVNKTVLEMRNITKLEVYFMDQANSVLIYPNEMELKGDRIQVNLKQESVPKIISFKTQISRSVHVEGDPLLDCAVYTEDKSYGKCIQNELNQAFMKEIGCVPPLLTVNPQKMCNKRFNLSNAKDASLNKLFKQLYYHSRKFDCKTPCTKNVFTSRLVHI